MSVTGRFRSDLIAAAIKGGEAPLPATGIGGGAATPYNNWLERMQRSRGRHAAITKNLYTWSSYKNWTEKVRENWSDPSGKPHTNGRPR